MATIKSFTSLEQSRVLAKILPLESADMHFINDKNAGCVPYLEITNGSNPWLKGTNISPAWSLAALLDLLPNNEHIKTTISRGSWKIDTIEYLPNIWWCEYEDNESLTEFNVSAENPVDACYELILKLNELNLL